MFLRKVCIQKDGKPHNYWTLVESYRTERGPRQRIVSYLGEMDEAGKLIIGYGEEEHPAVQDSLFEDTRAEWVGIDVGRVHTERSRRFGDVWLALEMMKKLGLTELFDRLMASTRPKVLWSEVANILVISRFCEPSSELHIAEHFYRTSALADLLGVPEEEVYENRLYRGLDELVVHKEEVQRYLKERLGELFEIKYDILLYDVTSTYFEGGANGNHQAQRGYSRDGRGDCKQVCIGLVVTREGMPLGYEVFEGNRHDSKTVETIVEKLESLYGKSDRVWIMDRGMVSPTNLRLVGAEGRRYIIGTPKNQLRKFEQHLVEKDWQEVHEGLEVKLCPSPEGGEEIFILCRSKARKEKEKAMHNKFTDQIKEGLERIKKSCESGRVKKVNVAERRIGRLLQKNQRASSLFEITVKEEDGHVKVDWTIDTSNTDWARLTEGYYLLRTNIKDWTPQELWKAYIQLTEAEEAFHIQKHDLQLRPVWHQKENRVKAHIFVCFIAYVLWKCFAQICKGAGLGDEPRQVVEEIKNLTLTDVVLPTKKGIELRLRCVNKPDKHLAILLHKLKMEPPLRLQQNQNL